MASRAKTVGTNVLRKEGAAKVAGTAHYIDDLTFPGLLYGRTIRSTIPAGSIVDVRPQFPAAGFTVVNYWDIPGRNIVALIETSYSMAYLDELTQLPSRRALNEAPIVLQP